MGNEGNLGERTLHRKGWKQGCEPDPRFHRYLKKAPKAVNKKEGAGSVIVNLPGNPFATFLSHWYVYYQRFSSIFTTSLFCHLRKPLKTLAKSHYYGC